MAGKPPFPAPVLYLRDAFGGDFEEMDAGVAVGTAGVQVTPNDPEACSLTIINTGSTNIALAPNNQVSLAAGIILFPGGSLSLQVQYDMTLPSREWWAIGSAAGGSLYYVRMRRYISVAEAGVQGS